jgi:hypothetical protein
MDILRVIKRASLVLEIFVDLDLVLVPELTS